MDAKEMEEFKDLLLAEKTKILKANLNNEEEKIGVEESGDIADIASKLYETEFFLQLADHDKETLEQIDRALEKIEEGTYGICEGTGNPIEKERLKAIPWTPYSIEYAQKLAKKR
jgi:RNA polymerase-binding protein DksA